MDNSLCHYGVKGMKWGVRRFQNHDGTLTSARKNRNRRTVKKKKRYTNEDKELDKMLFGTKGQKRIEQRMNKGNSYFMATAKEATRQTLSIIGPLKAANIILRKAESNPGAGKAFVNSFMKRYGNKAYKISQNHKFDPIDVLFKEL